MIRGAETAPVYLPEKSRSEWLIVAGIFTACCLYFRPYYDYTTLNADEGIVLQGAQRILNGEVLYRDFFSFYTPGSYYWMALLFKVFGNSILVPQAALIVYGGLYSVLTYLLARRVCSRSTALLTVYLLTLICPPYYFIPLHNWDSTLWALVALYLAVRFQESRHWGFAAAAGAFASLTCLFEQSKGAGLVLGLALGFGTIVLTERRGRPRTSVPGLSSGAFLAAFLLPFLITVAYFVAQHGLRAMLADCFWPLQHYGAAEAPYGFVAVNSSANDKNVMAGPWAYRLAVILLFSPHFILSVLPFLAAGTLGFWLLRLKRGEQSAVGGHYVLVSATLVGLLASTMASRPEFNHILFQAPLFVLVLAWGLNKSLFKSRLAQDVQTLMKYYVFWSFTALGLVLVGGPLHAHSLLQTRRGMLRAGAPDPALQELQARTRPGEKIFVYPYQPLYYYLTATLNPTHYEELHPGIHTPEQFAEVIRQLAEDRTPLIVYQPSFSDIIAVSFPATSAKILAEKDPLTEHILLHYRACTARRALQSWQMVFMVRKDLSCSLNPADVAERR
jgi:4-amino-4-deoxy-L-arabinose transferase-like glycosyltransferase